MRKYEPALEKYWVTQSGCFTLATTVALGIGVTDKKLPFCHGIQEERRGKQIITREYNDRTVYECFNNPFSFYCDIPDLILSPMPIDDSPCPKKRARYTPDPLPVAISVASGNSVSTLATLSDSPQDIILTCDAPNTDYIIMIDKHDCGKIKIGYCVRRHDGIRCHKNSGSIALCVLFIRGLITVMD